MRFQVSISSIQIYIIRKYRFELTLNQQIFNFLKTYSTDITEVNQLLVSSFIHQRGLKVERNLFLKQYMISKNSDDYQKVFNFLTHFQKTEHTKSFPFEALVEFFEFVISPSDKVINGAIYTPSNIREYITKQAFEDVKKRDFSQLKIADIACGCGGFLIDAAKQLHERTKKCFKDIYKENIFGLDIQEYSIERTKILLSLYAIEQGEDEEEFEFNLHAKDSLEFDWKKNDEQIRINDGFDMVLGNPPYVCSRNMDDRTKELLKNWSVCITGHPDLYIPFFQIGYELLAQGGILGYITVNTFIRSINGRAIRNYFSDNKVALKIIDFEGEQVFKARSTYTCIVFLTRNESYNLHYTVGSSENLTDDMLYKIYQYNQLDHFNGWSLKDSEFVAKCESIGKAFGSIYSTRSGIATLKNNVYMFTPIKETEYYYYIDENTPIEKGICKDIVNSNLLVRESTIDNIKEKIIFPYVYDNDIYPKPLDEETFKIGFPRTYEYLERHRDSLALRDKGKGKDYPIWYAFGRTQSLEKVKYKLFFPQLVRENFNSCISDDENLYFYNGMVAYSDDLIQLRILQKIFKTNIFWKYIENVSKNYNSNYYSLGKNYIKKFGIANFSAQEIEFLLKEFCQEDLDKFIFKKYSTP